MSGGAVVTGIGVAAANGLGTERYWAATLAGDSGIDRISRFDPSGYPVRLAGEVTDFRAAEHVPGRLVPQTDHGTHLGLTAAAWALEDAGVDPTTTDEYRQAVVTASSSGGTTFGQQEMARLYTRGPRWVGAYQSIAWFYAATTGQISIRHGLRGPCGVVCAEQCGGLDAAAQARDLVRNGMRVVVTGGTDASLCPYGLTAQLATGHLSTADDPATAYQPFGAGARGYVPGEGGAMLVVEPATASGGGAPHRRYGRIAGHAATFDPAPGSDRPPGLGRAVHAALADAGCRPEDVDVVFADAFGVPELDRQEADVLHRVFGPYGVPVTAPKTLTGRLYAGGGALDLATALLALRDQVIPPTVGTDGAAPGCAPLDLVRDGPREARLRAALVLARGHGGFNSAVVVTRAG